MRDDILSDNTVTSHRRSIEEAAEHRRQSALHSAVMVYGGHGDAERVLKGARLFEAFLKGDAADA